MTLLRLYVLGCAAWSEEAEHGETSINTTFHRNLQARVVNGEAVTTIYPHIVAFSRSKDGSQPIECGGTLVSPTHVLTAAHCNLENTYAMAGFLKSSDRRAAQVRVVVTTRKDASRPLQILPSGGILGHDFLIAMVDPPFDLGDGSVLKPARLPTTTTRPQLRTTVYGWGKISTDYQRKNAPSLRKAHLSIADSCPAHWHTMLCAGGGGSDACARDSGGPLMQRDTNVIVGIVSAGVGCGKIGYYTDVFAYKKFIEKTLLEPAPKLFGFLPVKISVPLIGISRTSYVVAFVFAVIVNICIAVFFLLRRRARLKSRPAPSNHILAVARPTDHPSRVDVPPGRPLIVPAGQPQPRPLIVPLRQPRPPRVPTRRRVRR